MTLGFVLVGVFLYLAWLTRRAVFLWPAFVLGLVMSRHYQEHREEQKRLRIVAFAFLTPFFFIKGGLNVSLSAVFSNIVLAIAPDTIASNVFFVSPNAGPARPRAPRRGRRGRGSRGGGGPGDVTVGPDQQGTDAGEFASVSGQLRGHGVQAVRETGVTGGGGRGGPQVEQDEPCGRQQAEQRGGGEA